MKRGVIRDNDGDYATGKIGKPEQTFCTCGGYNIAVLGEKVASHGLDQHSNATMLVSQNFTLIDGKQVCAALDLATCFHIATPGSDFTFLNDGDKDSTLTGISLTGNFSWPPKV